MEKVVIVVKRPTMQDGLSKRDWRIMVRSLRVFDSNRGSV